MKIDLDKVELGDQVWHDRYGFGIVRKVDAQTCEVQFNEASRLLTFTEGGYANGIKVLYWQQPIAFIPRKGQDYSKFHSIVAYLFEELYGGER